MTTTEKDSPASIQICEDNVWNSHMRIELSPIHTGGSARLRRGGSRDETQWIEPPLSSLCSQLYPADKQESEPTMVLPNRDPSRCLERWISIQRAAGMKQNGDVLGQLDSRCAALAGGTEGPGALTVVALHWQTTRQ